MPEASVAVIGAGIAGLSVALALKKNGYAVDLFEAAAELREVGAGITLGPNAMHGLAYLGVADQIVQAGTEPSSQTISHWQDGRELLEMPRAESREQYGAPYVYIHRADLSKILQVAALEAGVRLQPGKRLQSLNLARDEVVLNFADGSSSVSSLVVGADGLKSAVRALFEPSPSKFTGHIAFRALAPASPAIEHLVAQPGVHIGPEKMVVRYPLRHSRLLNLVFFARESGWTEDGWSIPASVDELHALYHDWCDDIGLFLEALTPATLHKWAINAHSPLPGWCLEDRVVLMGDAAHAMTPFLGQGAAMAIEDAVVFARALSESPNQRQALKRYEAARRERTHFVQEESRLNADRLQGPAAELYGLGKLRNEETLGLFNYNCATVSI